MFQIKKVILKAYEWWLFAKLNGVNTFPFYPKCDVLMNNLNESVNATILLQRDKQI